MIFDTHAHYDDEAFDGDRDCLLNSMQAGGVGRIVNVGAGMETSEKTVALTEQYDFLYGAVGVHPNEVGDMTAEDMDRLAGWSERSKIVAIGEIGLDYHYEEPPKEVQFRWFEAQMELAREKKLPIIVHSRDAAKDTLDIMRAEHNGQTGGVIHCFSYGVEMAREYLNMGYYIGVGGVVTFKNGKKLKEVVAYTPLDRIVLETDAPYLAPVPYRGKRNCSMYLTNVAEEIATIQGVDVDTVYETTFANAKKLYRM